MQGLQLPDESFKLFVKIFMYFFPFLSNLYTAVGVLERLIQPLEKSLSVIFFLEKSLSEKWER